MTDICVVRAPASVEVNEQIDRRLKAAYTEPEVLIFTFRAGGQVIYEKTAKAWYLSRNFAETWLFGQYSTTTFKRMLEILADVQRSSGRLVIDRTVSDSEAAQDVAASGLKVVRPQTNSEESSWWAAAHE